MNLFHTIQLLLMPSVVFVISALVETDGVLPISCNSACYFEFFHFVSQTQTVGLITLPSTCCCKS